MLQSVDCVTARVERAKKSEHIRLNGMSSEHGLVPVLPADRDQTACACRAERILHIFGNA
jgi:hypothetical protein